MQDLYLTWDPAQVALYILPLVDDNIVESFIENNIDGLLLPFLTSEHLQELGITQLRQRLQVKHAISSLIYDLYSPESITKNSELGRLSNVNTDSNFVSIEALNLCIKLLQDMPQPATTKEVKKLEEHFRKFKADLAPVVRLANELKPLPVPTLDPGPSKTLPTLAAGLSGSSSAFTSPDRESDSGTSTVNFQLSPGLYQRSSPIDHPENIDSCHAPKLQIAQSKTSYHQPLSSPSQSNRCSTASVLSTRVSKIAETRQTPKSRPSQNPRLMEASPIETDPASPNGLHTVSFKQQLKGKGTSSLITTANTSLGYKEMQPLQTFKASSDDTGLRLLQNAIRKNNIPRENWSKYALVICYDDKERIVKLNEKPVSIFKDLQEQGKNPTIMLRELVLPSNDDSNSDNDGNEDVPGGML